MQDKKRLGNYVSAFANNLSHRLAPNIEIYTIVHPAESEGAVIELRLEKGAGGKVHYESPTSTVNDALSVVPQNLVTGDLSDVRFRGTNISMQGNRIVLIKGDDTDEQWSDASAVADINRIFGLSEGSDDD